MEKQFANMAGAIRPEFLKQYDCREVEQILEQRNDLLAACIGLMDGLDSNGDPERCGLSQEQWDERIKDARQAIERAENA